MHISSRRNLHKFFAALESHVVILLILHTFDHLESLSETFVVLHHFYVHHHLAGL